MSHLILSIDPHIHIFWLPLIVFLSIMAGMMFRLAQLKKGRKQILSLETEMMNNHAEILRLRQKLSQLEKSSSGTPTPVVSLPVQTPEEIKDKPDVAQQKKTRL